jgi:acetyl-CoA C-acetyltransferase
MGSDDTRPVLVGGGQCVQRDVDLDAAQGPLELMTAAARQAADEAGVGSRIFEVLDAIGLVDTFGWRPNNAPRLLADALGARPSLEIATAVGGESPLVLLNHLAGEIASGRVRAALLAGANNVRTLQRVRRGGGRVQWKSGGEGEPTRLGKEKPGSTDREQRYGLTLPPIVYPLFENALRAKRGLDLEAHARAIGALMSPMTKVAASNPYAWFPVARSADELTTPGPDNRMIAFPYTKYLNAVLETDQSAAVLLLSAATARELGIPTSRDVHFWGGGSAVEEAWFPSERPSFAACDALRRASAQALAQAGTGLAEIDAFDLYSCFPVAVEMACEMLGLSEDDPRGFTVTGGLPYFGGPGNAYTLHAVVSMAERLRAKPGTRGLVTGNGWYFTKHSASVLASAARETGRPATPAPVFPSAGAPVPVLDEALGPARIETYTVTFERDGTPARGIVVGRLEDGGRFLANTPADRATLEDLLGREGVGRKGTVTSEEGKNVFRLE